MIRITQLKVPVGHTREELEAALIKKAGGRKPEQWNIVRRSIDARKKPELYYIYTVDASFAGEKKLLNMKKSPWTPAKQVKYHFPYQCKNGLTQEERPVIIGAGPAGLFAALLLARNGFRPIVFERGDSVEQRTRKVEHFFAGGELDTESNVQFGEGGAGTFSDGKLNTLVKDKYGRNTFVLQEFVRHGAPEEILYDAKPHIGTDILKDVVVSIREEIRSLGGEVYFETKVTELLLESRNGEQIIRGLRILSQGEEREWSCRNVILAVGHSARDTFAMLNEKQLKMAPKAFAIGVRVEHPAAMINESQYGNLYADQLSAASYKLTHQCANGRGIYSFCMCPGGYVVNASSEQGRLCVNGMSDHGRDGENSNSAIITTITPQDFGGQGPMAGIEFQRRYEALAYQIGQGKIPVQLWGDFKENVASTGLGQITPSIKGQWKLTNVRQCLPDYICESLLEGMTAFGRKIRGYDRSDTILAGVETRTSSPLRMERDERGQSNLAGLFPCGEGAGYAGGITSAAMDGMKMAEAVAGKILGE